MDPYRQHAAGETLGLKIRGKRLLQCRRRGFGFDVPSVNEEILIIPVCPHVIRASDIAVHLHAAGKIVYPKQPLCKIPAEHRINGVLELSVARRYSFFPGFPKENGWRYPVLKARSFPPRLPPPWLPIRPVSETSVLRGRCGKAPPRSRWCRPGSRRRSPQGSHRRMPSPRSPRDPFSALS